VNFGYARDAENVYLEGVRIAGAKSDSWGMVNRLYSRDAKNVFYLAHKLADVDLASFDVVPGSEEDDVFDSSLAWDCRGTIHRGSRGSRAWPRPDQFANAAIPVIARPRISACTSCVPS
jgi:DKNYY family